MVLSAWAYGSGPNTWILNAWMGLNGKPGSLHQSTIQTDPQVLWEMLSGCWAAHELGDDTSHQHGSFPHYQRDNTYMEVNPYYWQLPSNPMLGHSIPGTLPPPLVTTLVETGPVRSVGPSASMTMDSMQCRVSERPHPHSDFTVSHFGGADSTLQIERVQPRQLTYEEAAGLTTGTTTPTYNNTGRLPDSYLSNAITKKSECMDYTHVSYYDYTYYEGSQSS